LGLQGRSPQADPSDRKTLGSQDLDTDHAESPTGPRAGTPSGEGQSPQADPSDRKTLTGVVAIRPGNLRFSNFLSCGPALRSTGQDNYNIQMLATSSGPIVSAGNMGHATCARNACCSPRMRESTTPCVTMRSLRGRSVLTLQCGRRLTFRVILLAFGRIRRRNGRAPPGG
jgi:hypothetical protein